MNRSTTTIVLSLALLAALAGVVFSAASTRDFIAHLDRQVHAITCSFIPGVGAPDATGHSGCHTALMSPYSSFLRARTWGGVPISLLALSVFAYLLARAADMLFGGKGEEPGETLYFLLACLVPVFASGGYLYIALTKVGALCKLCVGIYVASLALIVLAVVAHVLARRAAATAETAGYREGQGIPFGRWAVYFAEGLLFVGLPLLLYGWLKPSYTEEMARCGQLAHPDDRYGTHVRLGGSTGGVPAIEVIDPLCPACAGFKTRLEASGLGSRLDLSGVLFPLDTACNWMLTDALHPGACLVSEAVLCAGDDGAEVVSWSLANNEELRELGRQNPQQLGERVRAAFPQVASCIGRPEVRSRLNKSLRWVVANALPIVTPQIYVNGSKICDEDTDLGLEYSLGRLLDRTPTHSAEAVTP